VKAVKAGRPRPRDSFNYTVLRQSNARKFGAFPPPPPSWERRFRDRARFGDVSRGVDGTGVWKYFQDKNRAPGMTEEKEATRETSEGPPSAPEQVVSDEVHAKGVHEDSICDSSCLKSPGESTLIVRNDRNLFQNSSLPHASERARDCSPRNLSRSRASVRSFPRDFSLSSLFLF